MFSEITVLVADDNFDSNAELQRRCRALGLNVRGAYTLNQAMELLGEDEIDIFVLDRALDGGKVNGLPLIDVWVKLRVGPILVIVDSYEDRHELLAIGVDSVLARPIDWPCFTAILRRFGWQAQVKHELQHTKEKLVALREASEARLSREEERKGREKAEKAKGDQEIRAQRTILIVLAFLSLLLGQGQKLAEVYRFLLSLL